MPRTATNRVLVTGASGFIGRSVVDSLGKCANVELLLWDRGQQGDLRSPEACLRVHQAMPDVLLHLAWTQTGTPGYEESPENTAWIEASVQLAKTCAKIDAFFIGLGTNLEHASSAHVSQYVSAKRAVFSRICQFMDPTAMSWLRPFWIFSLGDRRPRVLRAALESSASGASFVPSNPGLHLDFIDVRDAADAIARVACRRIPGENDVGSGKARRVDELLFAAGAMPGHGKRNPEVRNTYPVANMEFVLETGWRPIYTDQMFESTDLETDP